MNGATEKRHAHELIERLPDSQISIAIRFLEFILLDPVARAVATAPPDDEPVTEQDRSRFQEISPRSIHCMPRLTSAFKRPSGLGVDQDCLNCVPKANSPASAAAPAGELR